MQLNLKQQKVLLQYSGGKDSTACLVHLKSGNFDFEAIHFVHSFSYDLPTNEAVRLCKKFEVPFRVIDISDEIEKIFLNDFRLRPCRYCKSVMDKITLDYAIKNEFKLICVGDSKDDTTLINRLLPAANNDLTISKYFNKAVTLPDEIFIYRPMIHLSSAEILNFLERNGIKLARVGDTGDKYFEYSREGCPLQFKDFGVPYSLKLMRDLKKYNLLCSRFATERKIRASIHLPSEFIVTIPRGFEEDCRDYLVKNGCELSTKIKVEEPLKVYHFAVQIYKELLDDSVMTIALTRFLERMNCTVISQNNSGNSFEFCADKVRLLAFIEVENLKLYGHLTTTEECSINFMENIFMEIFHTRDIFIERIPDNVGLREDKK